MVNLVEQHPSPISLLPDELIVEILSNLPALDLAIAQETCKKWYSVAQNNSTLWRNTSSFFEKYYRSDQQGRNELQDKDQVAFQYKTFLQGINALLQSSKGQMDCILIDFDSILLLKGEADPRSQDKKVQDMFELIRKNDSTTRLWVNYPKRWSSTDIQTQEIFHCVLGSSNLKSLRLTSNMFSPSPFSSFPIDNYLIMSCRLDYFDVVGQHFEKWYNDEGLFTILQNVKHFKLRIRGRFPDSNTILYFLSRIQSTLTSIELLDDKDYGGDDFFIGELPFLNESEIILPELIHLTISRDGFQEFIEDLGGFRNAQNLTSEEAERMVQNELANRKLVCPKLEWKHDGFGELIVSLQSLVNLKTLKVATTHPDIITRIVSEIPKFVNVKFELLTFYSAMAINNFTTSKFCIPFEVEIDLSNDQDGCGKEIENLLKEFKTNNDEENQTKDFCVFEIKLASEQIVRKGISLADWWKTYGKLVKWHKEKTVNLNEYISDFQTLFINDM